MPEFRTAIEAARATLRTHNEQPGDTTVTRESHPLVFEAFETISHDSGLSSGHSHYFVPSGHARALAVTESALASLPEEVRGEHFVMGEGTVQQTLAALTPDLTTAHAFLNNFFEDWAEAETPVAGSALAAFAAERARQVSEEGWTPEHDDGHNDGQLAMAAAAYAFAGSVSNPPYRASLRHDDQGEAGEILNLLWPWGSSWWKPKDRKRDIERAGALLIAEWERINRAEAGAGDDAARKCLACAVAFKPDDLVLMDASGDFIHAACCGPERDGYCNLETGEPLGPNDPIPTGEPWRTFGLCALPEGGDA